MTGERGGFQIRIRIALLGYEAFAKRARQYTQYLKNVDVSVYGCLGYEAIPLVQRLKEEGIDAIVTGQMNYIIVKDKVNIPVIPFRVTFVDAVRALSQAKKLEEKKIALVYASFDDFEFDFKALSDFIGIEILELSYNSIWDLQTKIEGLKEQGINSLIGTTLAVSMCKELGMNGIEIYSVENIVLASIDKAIEVVKIIREKEGKEVLKNHIINHVHEGIVYIDEYGKIQIFNDEAMKLLKLEQIPVIGRHIDGVISDLKLTDTLRTGKKEINNLEKIKNIQLSISRIPVNIGEKTIGVVSTFQSIEDIEEIGEAIKKNKKTDGFVAKYTFDSIIGKNAKILEVIELSKKYARSDLPILIEGETGTGKELFVQSIHNYSHRKDNPFVAINCASLPNNLLESELFGYEPGSFTGANNNGKKGLFEIADGGTLFLDEINSISINFQAKLLRVIEEKEIIRIGGKKIIPIDVRIIASSNVRIKSILDKKGFREDLYYRIGTLKINIPPLRERISDLPYLVKGLSCEESLHKGYDMDDICTRIWEKLMNYHFPGNVRELKTFLQRFFILADEKRINDKAYINGLIDFCMDDVFEDMEQKPDESHSLNVFHENEKGIILNLLKQYKNNKSLVARHLGIGRNTLYRKMKALNINDE